MRSAPFMIAALLSAASSAAQPPASAPAPARPTVAAPPSRDAGTCLRDLHRHAEGRPAARAQRLGELPPGDLHLTVMRSVGGCFEPVIVRQGFGAVGEARRR